MKKLLTVLFVLICAYSFADAAPASPATPHFFVNDNGDRLNDSTPAPIKIVGASGTAFVNKFGQLHTVMRAMVDAGNSTTTALASGSSFVGSTTEILDYSEICVSVFSDAESAVDGLCVQFSSDGSTWLDDGACMSIDAGVSKTFSFQPERAYYRIKYTNSGQPQTSFSLSSILRKTRAKPSSHNINKAIVADDDAELVKSVITGQRDDGTFSNATLSNSDRIKTVSQPYGFAVAEGDIPGHTQIFKFGTRTAVTAGTSSTVWEGPTALYVYLDSAQLLKISSSDADDNGSGTGARTLTLVGLDENYDEISEVATMTGLSVVTTVASFTRIHRAYVATSGTSATNEGIITVTNFAGTTTQLVIPAGDGQTLMTVWTVPRGKRLYITNGSASTDSNKGARVSLFTRQLDGGILYPWRIRYRAYLFSGNENFPFGIPFVLPEKTDVQVRVLTPGSAGTTSFGATFDGWYEDME